MSCAGRVLSDLLYLQRRVQIGPMHELLSDFYRCEDALDRLVCSERIEQRTPQNHGALSRRAYIKNMCCKLAQLGPDVRDLLCQAKYWEMPVGLDSLLAASRCFIANTHTSLDLRADDDNIPRQLAMVWKDEFPKTDSDLIDLSHGLKWEIAQALLVDQDRISLSVSQEEDVTRVPVVILPPASARASSALSVWERLVSLAREPCSLLFHGKWTSKLALDASGHGPGDLDPSMCTHFIMEDLRRLLGHRCQLRNMGANGIVACLEHQAQQEAHRLLGRLDDLLSVRPGPTAVAHAHLSSSYTLTIARVHDCHHTGWLQGLAGQVAFSAAVDVSLVGIELLGVDESQGEERLALSLTLPCPNLHLKPRVHASWIATYQVSDITPQPPHTLLLLFARPLLAGEEAAVVSALLLSPSGAFKVSAADYMIC